MVPRPKQIFLLKIIKISNRYMKNVWYHQLSRKCQSNPEWNTASFLHWPLPPSSFKLLRLFQNHLSYHFRPANAGEQGRRDKQCRGFLKHNVIVSLGISHHTHKSCSFPCPFISTPYPCSAPQKIIN